MLSFVKVLFPLATAPLCAAYMQLFMFSIHAVVYVQHTCSCLCSAYMQLFMCSIHAVVYVQHTCCMQTIAHKLHTFLHMLVWHACGAEPIFVYAACKQYGCILCAACVQHTCVCAGVHICGMYAVYMPNMCMKVADIYAVCMLYVTGFAKTRLIACIRNTSYSLFSSTKYIFVHFLFS